MMISKNGKMIFALFLTIIALFAIFAILHITDIADAFWPSSDSIAKAKNILERSQEDLRQKGTELSVRRQTRHNFLKELEYYWIEERDGKAEEAIAKLIETLAKDFKISLNSLGNYKSSKVNEQFSFLDFNIEVTAPMEEIARFMVALHKAKPKFYWTRCILGPSKPNDAKELALRASLRIVCIDDPVLTKDIIGGRK